MPEENSLELALFSYKMLSFTKRGLNRGVVTASFTSLLLVFGALGKALSGKYNNAPRELCLQCMPVDLYSISEDGLIFELLRSVVAIVAPFSANKRGLSIAVDFALLRHPATEV